MSSKLETHSEDHSGKEKKELKEQFSFMKYSLIYKIIYLIDTKIKILLKKNI
jgi:hypothetical protein